MDDSPPPPVQAFDSLVDAEALPSLMDASPSKPPPTPEAADDGAPPPPAAAADGADGAPPPAGINSLPNELLGSIFAQLPQRQRARAALVCRRWAAVSRTSRVMWRAVTLDVSLGAPGCVERAEGFLAWLLPRAEAVRQLSVAGAAPAEGEGAAASAGLVFSNVVAAVSLLAPRLRELAIDWPGDLAVSQWAGALTALRSASFSARALSVRAGLGGLAALETLRLKSRAEPLRLPPPGGAPGGGPPPLPPRLASLKLEGCNLDHVPPCVSRLTALTDLVLTNNDLHRDDMGALAPLVNLRQLTLMGTRMARLPPQLRGLTALRVLYLDMGVATPHARPMHAQAADVLGPLPRLAILSLGSSRLSEFPAPLAASTSLRALYLDNNPLAELPRGPYLAGLRVLGIDWRVLFSSHGALADAPRLTKLCLTGIGTVEGAPAGAAEGAAVAASLTGHPSLRRVLMPMVDGQQKRVYVAALNVLLALGAAAPRLAARACLYSAIANEWHEWLAGLEGEEEWEAERAARRAGGAAAGSPRGAAGGDAAALVRRVHLE